MYQRHPDDRPSRAEAEEWAAEDKAYRTLHPEQFKGAPGYGTKYEPLYKPGEEPF